MRRTLASCTIQNFSTMRGWAIGNSTNFPARFSGNDFKVIVVRVEWAKLYKWSWKLGYSSHLLKMWNLWERWAEFQSIPVRPSTKHQIVLVGRPWKTGCEVSKTLLITCIRLTCDELQTQHSEQTDKHYNQLISWCNISVVVFSKVLC